MAKTIGGWDGRHELYQPTGGKEITEDGEVFDVTKWREDTTAILTTIDADTSSLDIKVKNDASGNVKTSIADPTTGTQAKVNALGRFRVDADLPKTAFGDLRTAELTPIIQHSFEYTVDNTELTTNTVVSGGTVTQADGMAVIASSTTTGSSAKLAGQHRLKYRAGQGGLFRGTALFTSPVAGTEQLVGLMDVAGSSVAFQNGYAFGYIGTTFGFHRFQNDTITTVAQSAWDDPMDGTGASGMTLDQTKLNVYAIRFQYLGGGKIELLIEDDSTGEFVVVHTILYANLNTTPSVHNPNFNCKLFVDNKATTSNLVLKTASFAYFVEGKTKLSELQQPQFATGQRSKSSVTTEVAIFTIRNKSLYATKTNFIDIILENITCSIEATAANNLGNIRVVKNATLGGTPIYADIQATNSVVEIDTAGTTVTGGKILLSLPLAGKNDSKILNLFDFDVILEPSSTITVSGTSTASATVNASILWKELF